MTDKQIEEKYLEGTFKLTQERNDFLLPQILDFVRTKSWINIHPEYQRRLVWDKTKMSLFIESLLMNIPIPPIFLYEYDYGRYEVMDGQQRLSTIMYFYENQFQLKGLEHWKELNGRTYADLPPLLKRALDRRRISASVILTESASTEEQKTKLRRFVFNRLNTGGQKLNKQELRNSNYAGNFNALLIRLAGNNLFDDIWGIPRYSENIRDGNISRKLAENALFKRMIDCEIVLRFFAYRESKYVKGSVSKILDNCMSRYQDASSEKLKELEELFISRLQASQEIFQDNVFRIADNKKKLKLSQPLFDAVMVAVDNEYAHVNEFVKKRGNIQAKFFEELEDEDNFKLVTGKLGTAPSIKKRAEFISNLLHNA
jgi:uncharacterized protein with ParB-like and HNH nuclease domain